MNESQKIKRATSSRREVQYAAIKASEGHGRRQERRRWIAWEMGCRWVAPIAMRARHLLIEHGVEHQQLGRGILVEDGRDHDRQRCPQQIVANQI